MEPPRHLETAYRELDCIVGRKDLYLELRCNLPERETLHNKHEGWVTSESMEGVDENPSPSIWGAAAMERGIDRGVREGSSASLL